MRRTADRVASNEARFADASGAREQSPMLRLQCECPSPDCQKLAELSLAEYTLLRLFPNYFVIAAGCRAGELAGTQIVERNERFIVVDRPT
jgi:hypothetical protein